MNYIGLPDRGSCQIDQIDHLSRMRYYCHDGSRIIICRSIKRQLACSGAGIHQEGGHPLMSRHLLVGQGRCHLSVQIIPNTENDNLQATLSQLLATEVFKQKITTL